MALAGALCCVVHAATGFTNKSLRGLVAGLLGSDYSTNQMTYDLRRLRLHGLIERIPRTNTYRLTPEELRVAVFYTKLQRRLLSPLLEADQPPAPTEIRRALATIDKTHQRISPKRSSRSRRLNLVTNQDLGPPSRTSSHNRWTRLPDCRQPVGDSHVRCRARANPVTL